MLKINLYLKKLKLVFSILQINGSNDFVIKYVVSKISSTTPQRGFGCPGFEIHGQTLKKIYVFMNVKETETSITSLTPPRGQSNSITMKGVT